MTQLPQTTPGSPSLPPRRFWMGQSWFQKGQEFIIPPLIFLCALVTVLTTIGIVAVLGVESIRFFQMSGVGVLEFLTGTTLNPKADPPKFGILPLIWGTFVIALGSSVVALPIGLLSAIYLSEYAPARLRAVLKPTLELLAGVPSIVYGYLALLLVTPVLKAVLEPMVRVEFYNALSASIVVGVMIIPMVSSLSEDVLSAVPRGLREAAYGLGATKFEVSTRVVLPAGLSGVLASFILAISRAVGETMAVLLAAGVKPQIVLNPLRSVETMTAYIVNTMKGEAAVGTPEHLSLYAVGLALFVVTLVMNIISGIILRHFREEYQ
ncbi:phosphate ABC transporter permease subunit PstC [Tautonia rosea]|uniref:phosphate ABC transporter permease subunit PstC n=1 Tax=Tautonia rosea TaxID=2728037 RepID=UPI0028F3E9BE|nr:phosphate ABC transporter permease subunit PstC [Tautonia rosea]